MTSDGTAQTSGGTAQTSDGTPKVIAFYLPQYHPIVENDEWWGKGFTDWRNVARARPRFRGHYMPHVPADLGFYDLRLPEARQAQAEMAAAHGVAGFCYYHYWFHGQQLLERPFAEVLSSGEPSFPFCLCWANESWTRAWDGRTSSVLAEQTYSTEDDLRHFDWLTRAFEDDRYIRVEGRPLFLVWRAHDLPDPRRTTDLWRTEAARRGIGELCLARVESFSLDHGDPALLGFDFAVEFQPDWRALGPPRGRRLANRIIARTTGIGRRALRDRIYSYDDVVERMLARPEVSYPRFPCVTPSWDNTARRETDGVVLHGSTPESYARWLTETVARLSSLPPAHRLLFVNAWNEWAEGSHLEPDRRFRRGYLEATKQAVAAAEAALQPRR